MNLRRLTAGLVLAVAGVMATAVSAHAHAELIGSNPAEGATLPAAPTQVQLTFNEPVIPESVTVTGPGGTQWTVGQVAVAGAVVTAPVRPAGPAGPHALAYRVRSSDGDPVTGTVSFTMAVAASPPTTSAATTTTTATTATSTTAADPSPAPAARQAGSTGGGPPAWVWVLLAVVVLALIAGGILLARRGRGGPAEQSGRS